MTPFYVPDVHILIEHLRMRARNRAAIKNRSKTVKIYVPYTRNTTGTVADDSVGDQSITRKSKYQLTHTRIIVDTARTYKATGKPRSRLILDR